MASGARLVAGGVSQRADRQGAVAAAAAWLAGVPRLLRTRSGTIGLNLNRVKLHKGGKQIRDPVETSRTLSDPRPARIRGIRPPRFDCPAETNSRCVCACVGLFSPRLLACLFVCLRGRGAPGRPGCPHLLLRFRGRRRAHPDPVSDLALRIGASQRATAHRLRSCCPADRAPQQVGGGVMRAMEPVCACADPRPVSAGAALVHVHPRPRSFPGCGGGEGEGERKEGGGRSEHTGERDRSDSGGASLSDLFSPPPLPGSFLERKFGGQLK